MSIAIPTVRLENCQWLVASVDLSENGRETRLAGVQNGSVVDIIDREGNWIPVRFLQQPFPHFFAAC